MVTQGEAVGNRGHLSKAAGGGDTWHIAFLPLRGGCTWGTSLHSSGSYSLFPVPCSLQGVLGSWLLHLK